MPGYFGDQMVNLANGLLGGPGPGRGEVEGIRACLTYQALRLRRRRSRFWRLLLNDETVFASGGYGSLGS